jgi:hypothetical protein
VLVVYVQKTRLLWTPLKRRRKNLARRIASAAGAEEDKSASTDYAIKFDWQANKKRIRLGRARDEQMLDETG